MALSIALITLFGLLFHLLFRKLRLPGLLGLLILGMVLGPYGMDLIDETTLAISADLRKIALIIILLRAGLGISRDELRQVGKAAFKMSLLPSLMEGSLITFLAVHWLQYPILDAAMLGFLIAAVSPAVVVPLMLNLMESRHQVKQHVPILILTGASLNAVIAITILSSLINLHSGDNPNLFWQAAAVPLSIVTGLMAGVLTALVLLWLFNRFEIRHTKKALILVSAAILMTAAEDALQGTLPLAALLGIMFAGFLILEKSPRTAEALSSKLGKVWLLAEIMLFVMVGAAVNFTLALEAGLMGVLIIGAGLLLRSLGVWLCLSGENFTTREKRFSMIAFSPKATVQAAAGGLPLAAGAMMGEEILALAVLSILLTAPLGAIGIQWGSRNLWTK